MIEPYSEEHLVPKTRRRHWVSESCDGLVLTITDYCTEVGGLSRHQTTDVFDAATLAHLQHWEQREIYKSRGGNPIKTQIVCLSTNSENLADFQSRATLVEGPTSALRKGNKQC